MLYHHIKADWFMPMCSKQWITAAQIQHQTKAVPTIMPHDKQRLGTFTTTTASISGEDGSVRAGGA